MQKLGKVIIGQKRTNESEVNMIVRGTAMWANVFDKNTLSDKYQIDICNLDKDTVKELEKAGMNVKKGDGEKADKGNFITAKSTFPPKVMDKGKRRWDEDTKIGNGSAVKCSIDLFEWSMNGKNGVSAGIKAVMVTNLIEYEGDDELEAEEDVEDDL